jgi:hypothetical protein
MRSDEPTLTLEVGAASLRMDQANQMMIQSECCTGCVRCYHAVFTASALTQPLCATRQCYCSTSGQWSQTLNQAKKQVRSDFGTASVVVACWRGDNEYLRL